MREREEDIPEHLEAGKGRLNLGEGQSAIQRKPPPDVRPCATRSGAAVHLGQENFELSEGEEMAKGMTNLDPVVKGGADGV